ncbi:Magnesium transport protein CorA [compost metagenome]
MAVPFSCTYTEKVYGNFKWIDIKDPQKEDLDGIAKMYGLDYYQVKDSLEAGHLPKYEKGDDYQFLILRAYTHAFHYKSNSITDITNKVAFFYNAQMVITIHRADFDFLTNVKPQQFAQSELLIIYLIHKILRTYDKPNLVLSERNEHLERTIFLRTRAKVSLEELYFQKAHTRIIKKLLLITQNVMHQVEIPKAVKVPMQDVRDTVLNLVLNFEEEWENANNLLNSYLNLDAQKTNGVMKLLTVFSAFFLPLTFIAGIYGMNFDFMPELRTRYGYFVVLGLMAAICVVIFIWFKRKRIF